MVLLVSSRTECHHCPDRGHSGHLGDSLDRPRSLHPRSRSLSSCTHWLRACSDSDSALSALALVAVSAELVRAMQHYHGSHCPRGPATHCTALHTRGAFQYAPAQTTGFGIACR